jgi:hypothetical protein
MLASEFVKDTALRPGAAYALRIAIRNELRNAPLQCTQLAQLGPDIQQMRIGDVSRFRAGSPWIPSH